MASVPRWLEFEDVPFSEMWPYELAESDGYPYPQRRRQVSQTSGVNPGLYTNYKKKPSKAKPKGK